MSADGSVGRAAGKIGREATAMTPRSWAVTIVVLLFFGAVPAWAAGDDTRIVEIIQNPTVTYQEAFSADVPLETWNRVLDHLYLMGQLWELYRFQPAYKVTRTDSTLHVVDPTGIVGDLRQISQSAHSRGFYGEGKFNHWAVPTFFAASGVIVFEYRMAHNQLLGEVRIFLRGNNWPSRLAMRLFSGTLIRHVDNRFRNNLGNTKRIIRDILNEPEKVSARLAGPLQNDFDAAFPIARSKRTEP
jgi:hypothetical protein